MTTARRGRPAVLPPNAPGPEAVPSILREQGRCAALGNFEVFDVEARWDEAKATCTACPVIEQCLMYALGNETDGLWAGMTPTERREMSNKVVPFSAEERLTASELRAERASGKTYEAIAFDWKCSTRTLERWFKNDTAA